MKACQEYEELLTLHAAEALEPAEAARVRAHVESCAACRAELESTARVLGEVALPAPSPAMREKLDAMPQRALGAWRREQVRKVLRARNMGALLAVAAAVMLVLSPSLHRARAPQPAQTPTAASSVSETQADFEQWASADPLGELLESSYSEEDMEDDWEEDAEGELPASDLF